VHEFSKDRRAYLPESASLVAALAFALGAFLFDRLRDTLAEEV